jgi:hypothetical protein
VQSLRGLVSGTCGMLKAVVLRLNLINCFCPPRFLASPDSISLPATVKLTIKSIQDLHTPFVSHLLTHYPKNPKTHSRARARCVCLLKHPFLPSFTLLTVLGKPRQHLPATTLNPTVKASQDPFLLS